VTAFTGARIDRAGDGRRRDPAWVAEQRAHPAARAVLAGDDGIVMDGDRIARVPLGDALEAGARAGAATAGPAAAEPLLLGIDAAGPLFAVDVYAPATVAERPPPLIDAGAPRGGAQRPPAPADGPRPVPLREAVAVLPQDEGGLLAYVAALCNWHRRHRFCATCGAPSELGEGGLIRACPRCGTQHHPRTDPVVIMLVTDGDRLMLGRSPSWPERRYSALAGFVEPGESLEEAVAREVAEESGVEVGTPRYVASQPWPFPASLMLGFEAPHRAGEPRAREEDVQDVRWFTRAEVAAAAAADTPRWSEATSAPRAGEPLLLPPRLAIARRLIERWLRA
jgi:NAD+ diphosphatase